MSNLTPVSLAYNIHEPVTGTDEKLSPILFLHGLTAFKESWGDIPQVVANATKRKCYSLDARNHGDSEWNDEFTFDLNVQDLIHFVDSAGFQKVILVGHSMGGITAINMALKRPERVEKIVVEDMYVRRCPRDVFTMILAFVTLLQEATQKVPVDLDEDAAKGFIVKYLYTNIPPELARVRDEARVQDPDATANFISLKRDANGRYSCKSNLKAIEKALLNYDNLASEPEGRFEGPAFFIYGTLSPFLVGADQHHIKQFFPNAVFEGIEADHSVHFAKRLEFTDALLKFIL